jgi:hypothetical protein
MSDEEKSDATEVVEKPETVNPAPEVTPAPVAKPEHADDDLRPIVAQLAETVSGLQATVAGLVATGENQLHDTAPTKKPWTHRSFG